MNDYFRYEKWQELMEGLRQDKTDDDTPRLAAADWLEENFGECERSQLIRSSVDRHTRLPKLPHLICNELVEPIRGYLAPTKDAVRNINEFFRNKTITVRTSRNDPNDVFRYVANYVEMRLPAARPDDSSLSFYMLVKSVTPCEGMATLSLWDVKGEVVAQEDADPGYKERLYLSSLENLLINQINEEHPFNYHKFNLDGIYLNPEDRKTDCFWHKGFVVEIATEGEWMEKLGVARKYEPFAYARAVTNPPRTYSFVKGTMLYDKGTDKERKEAKNPLLGTSIYKNLQELGAKEWGAEGIVVSCNNRLPFFPNVLDPAGLVLPIAHEDFEITAQDIMNLRPDLLRPWAGGEPGMIYVGPTPGAILHNLPDEGPIPDGDWEEGDWEENDSDIEDSDLDEEALDGDQE